MKAELPALGCLRRRSAPAGTALAQPADSQSWSEPAPSWLCVISVCRRSVERYARGGRTSGRARSSPPAPGVCAKYGLSTAQEGPRRSPI